MATTSTAPRLTTESKTFVSFVSKYFGVKYVKSLNARQDNGRVTYILGEVARIAHHGDYAEVPRQFEEAACSLGWAFETGRLNGATHLTLRSMSVKDLLGLVGYIHDLGLTQGQVATYLMGLNLQPAA